MTAVIRKCHFNVIFGSSKLYNLRNIIISVSRGHWSVLLR